MTEKDRETAGISMEISPDLDEIIRSYRNGLARHKKRSDDVVSELVSAGMLEPTDSSDRLDCRRVPVQAFGLLCQSCGQGRGEDKTCFFCGSRSKPLRVENHRIVE
jgi:hypothetical protein